MARLGVHDARRNGRQFLAHVLVCGCLAVVLPQTFGQSVATQPAEPPTTAPAAIPSTQPTPLELSLKIVGETDPRIRLADAKKLVAIGTPDAAKAILTILEATNYLAAKVSVCQAMNEAQVQEPAFKPALMTMLDAQDATLRQAAYEALAAFKDADVVAKRYAVRREQKLLRLIDSVRDKMKGLYDLTPEASRSQLLEGWLKEPITEVKLAALEYVHAPLRQQGTLPVKAVLDQVRILLNDADPEVRLKAVIVLRDCHQIADAELLHGMLKTPQVDAVREAIYNALGKLGELSSLGPCVAGLKDPVETVAAEAAAALGRLAEIKPAPSEKQMEPVIKALLARAADPMTAPKLRENVLTTMGVIGDPGFIPVLASYAVPSEAQPTVRQAAVFGLGRMAVMAHAQLVMDRLADPDPGVRESAGVAVGRIADALVGAGKQADAESLMEKALDAASSDYPELQILLATRLVEVFCANGSAIKAIDRVARLPAKAREATATPFHKYAAAQAKIDPARTLAFMDYLVKQIPDQFGAAWAGKFDEVRASIQTAGAPGSQPAGQGG